MNLKDTDLEKLQSELLNTIKSISNIQELNSLKATWIGKDGTIKEWFKQLRDIPNEDKPSIAAGLNKFKDSIELALKDQETQINQSLLTEKISSQFFDLSLPAEDPGLGSLHPIRLVERKISEILKPFGFSNVLGPEVETEYFCFDSLNIPKHHPARDLQDTFYTEDGFVLRTHTTSVQARTLSKGGLPIKVASFGKVFRNETEDASHQAIFHQFELVWIEKGLSLSNLMALITHILKSLYGQRRKVRFVPKFYPYTEPSIGAQINCTICNGAGCPSCGGAGWVTIGGAGMIHRNVLKEFNYDHKEVSGFAFGLGTSRLAGQMYEIPKLKQLYENDLRVLKGVNR
jgi:phenylalanyl-tRNA synthetase alpha chain